jgi:hypothetical protein
MIRKLLPLSTRNSPHKEGDGGVYLSLAGRFALITGRFVDLLSPEGSTGFVEDVSDAFLGDGALFGFGGHGRVGFLACNEKKTFSYRHLSTRSDR